MTSAKHGHKSEAGAETANRSTAKSKQNMTR